MLRKIGNWLFTILYQNLHNWKNLLPSFIPLHFTMCPCWAFASPWASWRTIYRDESFGYFHTCFWIRTARFFSLWVYVHFTWLHFICISVWSSLFSLWEVSCSLILHFKRLRKETSKKSQILGNNISQVQWWLIIYYFHRF